MNTRHDAKLVCYSGIKMKFIAGQRTQSALYVAHKQSETCTMICGRARVLLWVK
jgi:hypothetical protein